MELALVMEEVRTHWHRLEGEGDRSAVHAVRNPYEKSQLTAGSAPESQSQFGTPSQFPPEESTQQPLADEVIWHCLRPILHYTASANKDEMPKEVRLVPDEVAKLAAHHVFLRGTPRSPASSKSSASQKLGAGSAVWWDQDDFTEAWSLRLPSMPRYEPTLELLQGIAICKRKEIITSANGSEGAEGSTTQRSILLQWQYFPEAALPLTPLLRVKSMFAMRTLWTLEEIVPYLQKFIVGIELEVEERGGGETKGLMQSRVADLVGQYAKAMSVVENKDGKDVTVIKYVALPH